MGITIETFEHDFVASEGPTVEGAKVIQGGMDPGDLWVVCPVVAGVIDWRGYPVKRMYGREDCSLPGTATGYLVVRYDQARGMAYHGEAGKALRARDLSAARRESYADLCRLYGRLL